MRFGPVPVEESLGGILAHGVKFKDVVLRKGEIIQDIHIVKLKTVGFETIVVAELDEGDVGEDLAALSLAQAVTGQNLSIEAPSTGRVNIYAACNGLFVPDETFIHRINDVDEAITLATLPPMCRVQPGEMVATVKIIPFAVPKQVLAHVVSVAKSDILSVASFLPLRIGVISTLLPGLKPSIVSKTVEILTERIAMTPAKIIEEQRIFHEAAALSQAIESLSQTSDVVIIFGATAITDRRDVIPAAIEKCRGHVLHFGMPVDPGNLLLLGQLGNGTPVIGAPGCARSPKENGFDWILYRLLTGQAIAPRDIKRLGVGGLLIRSTNHPSSNQATTYQVAR